MSFRGHHQILKELVDIPSVYPNEQKIAEYCHKKLVELGFTVEVVEIEGGRKNLLASRGRGKKTVIFYGHLDTVPIVERSAWNSDPYKLTEKDGNYYGLGVSDTKAGIAAFLEASKEYEGYLKIFLAVDEENISEGAWEVVKKRPDFFKDVELAIHVEPTINMPSHAIANGRVGRRIFEAKFLGIAEHIYNYKKGIDAIKKLGVFIDRLYQERETMFNSVFSVVQVRKISGEAVGMSVPAYAEALVEVLLGEGDTEESVLRKLKSIGDCEISLKPRKTPYLDQFHYPDFPYKGVIGGIIKDNLNHEMELVYRSSVGDENVIASLGVPVVTWGPWGGNEHTNNEFVNIGSFDMMTKMYGEFLEKIKN